MRKIHPILLLILVFSFGALTAQQYNNDELPDELKLTRQDTTIVSSNLVGLGFNMIMDTGDRLNNFPGSSEDWHIVPYPSRLSFGRNFKSGIGLEGIATVNRFMEGKMVEGAILTEDRSYFAVDSRLSYNISRLFGRTGWFDPYVGVGLGYTSIEGAGSGTFNGVLGLRAWLSEHWGIDINSSGKWALGDDITNHMQHGAGVVYQFNVKKELSKKGWDKIRLIEEYLQEKKKRQDDSIAAVRQAEEEARILAERVQKEKEARELAEAESARREAEKKLKENIRRKLEDVGYAHFGFDSSYLTASAKEVLDLVGDFMKDYPEVTIKITAHADSRGSQKYNQWLSERRAKRSLDYLLSKNIAEDRITAEGKGELELRNECADGVPCPEAKHRENRRSQFILIEF